MKRFLYSLLGSLAAIWISFGIFFLLFILILAAAATNGSSVTPVKVDKHSILHIDLSGGIVDRQLPINIMDEIYGQSTQQIPLNKLVGAIEIAKEDDRIEGIYLECNGGGGGLAQSQALINAITDFKQSGKWVMAYSDNFTQGNYFIASAADSIFLNPIGMVDIHGLTATTMFFKDLLDKIGVEAQVVKVGTYKSAVEPFILTDMSEANREQQLHYITNIWNVLTDAIAQSRHVTPQTVNNWADSFAYAQSADYYVKNKIIDKTLYRHEMKEMLGRITDEEEPNLIDAIAYFDSENNGSTGKKKVNIAVLYAIGDITESGRDGITSDKLVPEILKLAENKNIDGLILRVNSGGGSAFASEQIWEALEQFKKISSKPFYVSMGDMAAAGGYYISCGADRIYAESLTLTGSIGIFGIIPNAQKLLNDKLGINTATISTNKGDFPGFLKPMSSEQRAAMQGYVDRGYKLFVSRCAAGRHVPYDSIAAIAEGRVWDGKSALERGLVDKLGGLDMALADMAADLDAADDYSVQEFPKLTTKWWEQALEMSKADMKSRMVINELGDAAPIYNTLRSLKDMDYLQCRMDFVTIE